MPGEGKLHVRQGTEQTIVDAALTLARARKEQQGRNVFTTIPDPVDWIEKNFRVEDTGQLIQLERFQAAVLRYCLKRKANGHLPFPTVIWSQVKKSGKTTIAGAVTQYATETWGRFPEIYTVGNDADQARERAFAQMKKSIMARPDYIESRQAVPGQWILHEKKFMCLKNGATVKAIAADFKGEAGSNPVLTVWTELWGYTSDAALKFWAEMAPSPTRPDSMRWVETYAGFEGESELLYGLYDNAVNKGRQLTAGEIGDVGCFDEAPNPTDKVPCYVNEASGIFAFWDSGPEARRMPWQQGEQGERYYANEASTQTPGQFDRLHYNLWVSAESAFVPIEQWDSCRRPAPLAPGDKTPIVLALDAAVSGDCFGLVGVSRDPDNKADVAIRIVRKWDPPQGGTIDYAGPRAAVKQICKDYNVVEIAYDMYQLHDFATTLMKEGIGWFRVFNQDAERRKSDKLLFDLIMHRRIRHDGNLELREHITNANAKQSLEGDTKLKIVKKSESRKIDLVVCTSMASAECLRLQL